MSQFIVRFWFLFSSIHWMVFNNKHTWARCADIFYNVCDSHGNVSLCPLPLFNVKHWNIMYVWKPWKVSECFPKHLQILFTWWTERSVRVWGSLLVETKNNETIGTEIAIMMYISTICGTVLEVDPWSLIWLRFLAQFELKQEGAVLRCHQQTQICMTTTFFISWEKTGLRPHVRPKPHVPAPSQDFHIWVIPTSTFFFLPKRFLSWGKVYRASASVQAKACSLHAEKSWLFSESSH